MRIWKEFRTKTHNFTYPLLVHITADNPTNKSTLNHSDNTHKRKQAILAYVQGYDYYQNMEIQCF